MRFFSQKSWIIVIITVAVLGFGINAMAYRGMGYNCRFQNNVSPEEQQKITDAQEAFFTATKDLRDQIRAKADVLDAELGKETPDKAVATQMQTELSGLEAQYDQKRLEYQLQMRELVPADNTDSGWPMGRGYGMRGGAGRGGHCF